MLHGSPGQVVYLFGYQQSDQLQRIAFHHGIDSRDRATNEDLINYITHHNCNDSCPFIAYILKIVVAAGNVDGHV